MNDTVTMKELQHATGAPKYVINYLKENGRLPIAQESKGRGYPTLYDPYAVEVVKDHLGKARDQNEQPLGNN